MNQTNPLQIVLACLAATDVITEKQANVAWSYLGKRIAPATMAEMVSQLRDALS